MSKERVALPKSDDIYGLMRDTSGGCYITTRVNGNEVLTT